VCPHAWFDCQPVHTPYSIQLHVPMKKISVGRRKLQSARLSASHTPQTYRADRFKKLLFGARRCLREGVGPVRYLHFFHEKDIVHNDFKDFRSDSYRFKVCALYFQSHAAGYVANLRALHRIKGRFADLTCWRQTGPPGW